jgi:8-oxo-dGTP diphosphatase
MTSHFAVKAVIEKDGKFLIVKRSNKDKSAPNKWEIPGGGVERNEGPLEAMQREIMEECGINVNILQPIRAWEFMHDKKTRVVGVTFLCKYKSGEVKLSKEHSEFEWIHPDDADEYDSVEWIKKDFEAALK